MVMIVGVIYIYIYLALHGLHRGRQRGQINTGITRHLKSFCKFNALRKNHLLAFCEELQPVFLRAGTATNKYRDYYFRPQFEIGQQELIHLHQFTSEMDLRSMLGKGAEKALSSNVQAVNQFFQSQDKILFSMNDHSNYDKLMPGISLWSTGSTGTSS